MPPPTTMEKTWRLTGRVALRQTFERQRDVDLLEVARLKPVPPPKRAGWGTGARGPSK